MLLQVAKYGVTPEQYDAMVLASNGKCEICGNPERKIRRDGNLLTLSLDHHHGTLMARGLICSDCNLAIGHAMESSERLRKMARYLEVYESKHNEKSFDTRSKQES